MEGVSRVKLREEIKNVLAETFSAAELFTIPTEKAVVEILTRCLLHTNSFSYVPTLANGSVDYTTLQSNVQMELRRAARGYVQQVVSNLQNNLP